MQEEARNDSTTPIALNSARQPQRRPKLAPIATKVEEQVIHFGVPQPPGTEPPVKLLMSMTPVAVITIAREYLRLAAERGWKPIDEYGTAHDVEALREPKPAGVGA